MKQDTESGLMSEWTQPSVLALLVANAFPLVGVFLFGWEVFPLLVIFWMENVIVGFFNILKMLAVPMQPALAHLAKLFMVPFFSVHYGMFTFVHGVFVMVLFGGKERMSGGFPGLSDWVNVVREERLGWAVFALFLSHGVSFVYNFLIGGERHQVSLPQLMGQPYARVVVLHLTILIGGGLMMALGSPWAGLLFLVVTKTVVDLRSHLSERARFGGQKDGVSLD
jgi:hypothetical protein